MAQLPPVGHEQFYSILAANDDMVFMHVDEAGGKSVYKPHLFTHYYVVLSSMQSCNCETVRVMHYVCVLVYFTDTGVGTIYVSDDRGTVYSKSLERHLYTTTGGETDFTNVTSLRGVFTTSVLTEGIYSCDCA